MKLDAIAQNPLEWLALKSGLVPTPLGHSHIAFILSKAVLEATDIGIFEALEEKPGRVVQPQQGAFAGLSAGGYWYYRQAYQ